MNLMEFLVFSGSFCLKDPDAAFLGFANFSLKILKSAVFDKHFSSYINFRRKKFFPLRIFGMSSIVFKFAVISSPSIPSPLERP